MKYKHLKNLALIQKEYIPYNKAVNITRIMWVIQLIYKDRRKEMVEYEKLIEIPFFEPKTKEEMKELEKKAFEDGWKELEKQLKTRRLKIFNPFENTWRTAKDFIDIKTFDKISDTYKDVISFYIN